jgi:hypothetical protein
MKSIASPDGKSMVPNLRLEGRILCFKRPSLGRTYTLFQKTFAQKGVGFGLNENEETAKSAKRLKTHGLAFV